MKTAWLLFLSAFASAQITEELRVVYKDIRVHVVDRDGNPVKGLTIDDFLLKENGKFRDIGYFEEVDLRAQAEDPTPAQAPEPVIELTEERKPAARDPLLDKPVSQADRFLVLFLDSGHMTKGVFDDVKEAVVDFIDQNVSEQDVVKIVQMDDRFEHLTPFTKNKEELKKAVREAPYKGRLRRELRRVQRRINDGIQDWDSVSEDLKTGLEFGINADIREKGRLKAIAYQTFYYNMLYVARMVEHMKGPKSIYLFTSGSYLEHNSRYSSTVEDSEALGRTLNSANATIYSMLFKSPNPLANGTRAFNITSRSPDFALSLNSFSEFPPNPLGLTEVAANTIVEDNDQLETGARAAADTTGGLFVRAFQAREDIVANLQRVDQTANHFYRIVYPLNNPDRITRVNVELVDGGPGWKVLYGKEFEKQKSYLELKREERDIAFSAMLVYSQSYRNDLDARFNYHLFSNDDGGYVVPIVGEAPVDELPKKGFEFGFVALDENRELLDLVSSVLTDLPNVDRLNYYDVLLTKEPPRYIRASVRNMSTGDLTFYELPVDPKLTQASGEPHLSEVLVTAPDAVSQSLGINHLRMMKGDKKEKEDEVNIRRRDRDPFQMDDRYFKPSVRPYVFKPGPLLFMFHLENPAPEAKYQMQFLVQSDKGYHQVPGRLVKEWQQDENSVHYQGALNASNLPADEYTLWIRLTDVAAKKAYMSSAKFTIGAGQGS